MPTSFTQSVLVGFTLLWGITAIFDYLAITYLWQLKEYRWDRFKDFVLTKQGQQVFLAYRFVWKALLALVLHQIALYTAAPHTNAFIFFLYVVLGIDLLINIRQVLAHKVKRPILTSKALFIVLTAGIMELALIYIFSSVSLLYIFFILRFFIVTIAVFIFSFPTQLLKSIIIRRATKKMADLKHLTVIGITGSYGKTTIKEFTADILSKKFIVIKTPRNTNTEIGVAKFILATDFTDANVFVVEMGAYKEGEIKRICDIVKPTIGILSAINEQHLALFGSIKNIQKTKYELLRSIPEDGLVVTNADNEYCRELLHTLTCKNIKTFGIDQQYNPNCLITDIKTTKDGVVCSGTYDGVQGHIKAPVLGAHQATNIAAAAIVAMYLGMSKEEVVNSIGILKNASDTALKKYSYGKAIIIDDSYNSNPDGFKAALELLSGFGSKLTRIVITRGMVELGERSPALHEELGEEIAFYADILIVTDQDAAKHFRTGVSHLKGKFSLSIETLFDEDALLKRVKELKETESVILLESRIAAKVYAEIKQG